MPCEERLDENINYHCSRGKQTCGFEKEKKFTPTARSILLGNDSNMRLAMLSAEVLLPYING